MTTTKGPNPGTAFLQMQKAQAANAARAAKPKIVTSQSAGYEVKIPKPTLAATGEPVDIDELVGIDPELDIHDLDGITLEEIAASDAELTALNGGISDDEFDAEPTNVRDSWMLNPTEVGLDASYGHGARLRRFDVIDEQDPHDSLNDDFVDGFHMVAA